MEDAWPVLEQAARDRCPGETGDQALGRRDRRESATPGPKQPGDMA
ncbi:MAG: hypothetical protein AVDCRST_MAG88-2788 [uncultured Thermomicrobiales bacterium]|uniref:Uncharacterized protein n=1 Tax=uncultured Thermomicrobiales bacterium TaxID=1645740 RepID=A0A6J4VGF3_9BACT|nr:MAG: hypothetical protein AVDCRST_MAG88-2788 [uncultured Thermomicrobiales bacterium]